MDNELQQLKEEAQGFNHINENSAELSMAELLESQVFELEPQAGETRQGTIVSIKKDEILVSIGAKSEGVIKDRELESIPPEEKEAFSVDQEITVFILAPDERGGPLRLSYMRAREEKDWLKAQELLNSGEIYQSKIIGYNKGGLITNIGCLRGFIPASQVSNERRPPQNLTGSIDKHWGKMIGEIINFRVIEVDQERRRLILSEKAAEQETREASKDKLLNEIQVGDVRRGRVTSLADFGAFINIDGADGLVHLSEISWEHLEKPSDSLKIGQEVEVKVISVDRDKKRIGLSIRQLQEDPQTQKMKSLRVGQLVEGVITHLTKFGAFAKIGEDEELEGLIHISELSEERINHPKEIVKEGDRLTLRIIKLEPERKRIGLSLRKVDSAAYADLDWKIALAEEVVEAKDFNTQSSEQEDNNEDSSAEEISHNNPIE